MADTTTKLDINTVEFHKVVLRSFADACSKTDKSHLARQLERVWTKELVDAVKSYRMEDGTVSFRISKTVFMKDTKRANAAMQSLQACAAGVGRRARFAKGRYSGELHISSR